MSATRIIVSAAFVAAVLAGWLLLRPSHEPQAGAGNTSVTIPVIPGGTAPVVPLPAQGSSAPPSAGAPDTTPAEGDAAGGPAAPLAPVDQRQNAKIARGLSPNPSGGLRVGETEPGTIAGQLRLKVGDVIVSVNGQTISSTDDFVRIYREQGTPTELTILRQGREIHLH
jgi:membrane-associated protease RseP (regulator of RpoE activity)